MPEEEKKGIDSIRTDKTVLYNKKPSGERDEQPVGEAKPSKSKSKMPLIIISVVVLIAAAAGGSYMYMNKGTVATQPTVTPSQTAQMQLEPLPESLPNKMVSVSDMKPVQPVSSIAPSGIAPQQSVNGFVTDHVNELGSPKEVTTADNTRLLTASVVEEKPTELRLDPEFAREMRKTQAEISTLRLIVTDIQTMMVDLSNRIDSMHQLITSNTKKLASYKKHAATKKKHVFKKAKYKKKYVKKHVAKVVRKKMPAYVIDSIVDGRAWIHRKGSQNVFAISEGRNLDKKYGKIKSINSSGKIITSHGVVNIVHD